MPLRGSGLKGTTSLWVSGKRIFLEQVASELDADSQDVRDRKRRTSQQREPQAQDMKKEVEAATRLGRQAKARLGRP